MNLSLVIKKVLRDILPPIVVRLVRPASANPMATDPQAARTDAFYASLVPPGALCFDIGANMGNRLSAFRRLGFRVVALEPAASCHAVLQAHHGSDPQVTLIRQAVGRQPGRAVMRLSNHDVLSTLSTEFIEATTRSGRFAGVTWDKTEEVEVTTLDALIARHGIPDFVKVDVEGFELEVVLGLSRPLPLLALEWAPELSDNLIACIDHLTRLGPVSFNLSWSESMRLARTRWMDAAEIKALIHSFREETWLFADIYVRSAPGAALPP